MNDSKIYLNSISTHSTDLQTYTKLSDPLAGGNISSTI